MRCVPLSGLYFQKSLAESVVDQLGPVVGVQFHHQVLPVPFHGVDGAGAIHIPPLEAGSHRVRVMGAN